MLTSSSGHKWQMEAAPLFETSASTHHTAQCYKPEDHNTNLHGSGNFKCHFYCSGRALIHAEGFIREQLGEGTTNRFMFRGLKAKISQQAKTLVWGSSLQSWADCNARSLSEDKRNVQWQNLQKMLPWWRLAKKCVLWNVSRVFELRTNTATAWHQDSPTYSNLKEAQISRSQIKISVCNCRRFGNNSSALNLRFQSALCASELILNVSQLQQLPRF
jgi:hypothetical protein